jgi:hypothetical protein
MPKFHSMNTMVTVQLNATFGKEVFGFESSQ